MNITIIKIFRATTHPHQTHFAFYELGIVGYFLIIGNLSLIIFILKSKEQIHIK